MSDVKQILIVDDHFEILEFLRSMLELSNKDHQVVAVPSAEEGMLELRLTQFDLLITDVRLPGMSGFDLVRRAKRIRPEMPVIMITAYTSDQGEQEARDLGVFRYFNKPLDTDAMLTAVNVALYGELEADTPPAEIAPIDVQIAPELETAVTAEVRRRLETLRTDTGAMRLMLAATAGKVLFESGSGGNLDLSHLVTILSRNLGNNFLLADLLGNKTPFNLLYQTGDAIGMYSVNVGRNYFVTLFFESDSRRGRIGTVWVFVQRAIKDLVKMLPAFEVAKSPLPEAASPPPQSTSAPKPMRQPAKPSRRATSAQTEAKPTPKPIPTPPKPAPKPEPEPDPIEITPEQEAAFADLFAAIDAKGDKQNGPQMDLDSFWDTAVTESAASTTASSGLSFAEAQKQGLIPGGLTPPVAASPTSTAAASSPAKPALIPEPEIEPEPEPEPAVELNPEELAKFEDMFSAFDGASSDGADLDSFWDNALTQDAPTSGGGLSFEEAKKRGLFPSGNLEGNE